MVRTLLLSSAALAISSSAAFAAPPPPVFTWTGFYVGLNAGVSGATSTQNLSDPAFLGGAPYETFNGNGWGFSGGGQIGYNYQFPNSNYVVGFETDFQGTTLFSNYYNLDLSGAAFFPFSEKDRTSLDWWGTARGRFGYAFGPILPYVTGGFAYGHSEDTISVSAGAAGIQVMPSSGIRVGWTAGAGVEYALSNNLTMKVEGLYTDLGDQSGSSNFAGLLAAPNISNSTKFSFTTIRAGLDWKFGDAWPAEGDQAFPTMPNFMPRYPAGFTWSGPYVGANAGLSVATSTQADYEIPLFPTTPFSTFTGDGWGFSGGGQIGYNYQFPNSHYVIGAETDFQGSTLESKYFNFSYVLAPGVTLQDQTNLDWWGTLRGRFGYAIGGFLPYVTGGFAYGHTSESGHVNEPGFVGAINTGGLRPGWTGGVGLEYAMTDNLTFKVEGLYTDLGKLTASNDDQGVLPQPNFSVSTKFAFSTVRAGLNWKVDWFAPPP